jgi:stress response protein YsnF
VTNLETNQLAGWIGHDAIDSDGDTIGEIVDIYADDVTGEPEWLAVKTGWFGRNISFVPISGATERDGSLCVRWSKEHVKAAPNADPDGALSSDEEDALYRHYEMSEVRGSAELSTSGRSTDDAMTRSEEELRVGTTTEEAGRARLRKWVETEHVATTVPVERETARIEREPIDASNIDAALSGPEITEADHEVVLHEEHAVADTEVVPKERIRMEKETVVEQETVGAELRKEHIEVEGVPAEDDLR